MSTAGWYAVFSGSMCNLPRRCQRRCGRVGSDGRLEVVSTPGHTPGSTSVRLRTDEGEVWFVGDATFRVDELGPDAPATAMHTDVRSVRSFQAFLRGRREAIAILPAHDGEVPARLAGLSSR